MRYRTILEYARDLRKNQTPAEIYFWGKVRSRGFEGYKFNRQFIIEYPDKLGVKSFYIVDFYCHSRRLIVEIDGSIHQYKLEHDAVRQGILEEMGYRVLRFTNEEILNDWENSEQKLKRFLQTR